MLEMSIYEFDDIWVQENLTPSQAAMLDCLVKSGKERVPVERLIAVYSNARSFSVDHEECAGSSVRVYIWQLKTKLHQLGVTITNRHGWGYRLDKLLAPATNQPHIHVERDPGIRE
jgi:DNA-binding response OmpR family regulator